MQRGTRAVATIALLRALVPRPRVHRVGLTGPGGAGKSTLGKILSGIHEADSGQVLLDGRPVRFASPTDAPADGWRTTVEFSAVDYNADLGEEMFTVGYLGQKGK